MTNEDLRAAVIAALRRRGTIDDLDVTPSLTLLGSRTSTASVVIYGHDGAVIDVVARAGDDAKALRGVAFACGLREDGGDPAEEVERLRAELAETERRLDAEISAMDARDGAYHALDGARDGSDDLVALAECRMAEIGRLRTDNARLDDVARGALDDLARMRAELDATREALRAHLFCDECEELATRCHAESASFGCDAHGVGDGWRDTTHADAVRAAGGVR